MGWVGIPGAAMGGWLRQRFFLQADFDASPDAYMLALARGASRVWYPWPYVQFIVTRNIPAPGALCVAQTVTPHLKVGGLPPGLTTFRLELVIAVTPGGGEMVRGIFDSNGLKHIEGAGWQYPQFKCRIPSSGILDWGNDNMEAARWARPPDAVGANGFIGWISQLWRWA